MGSSYRSILLLLDASPTCADRIGAAIRLAKAHGAHLLGVAPTGLGDTHDARVFEREVAVHADRAWDQLKAHAESAVLQFRDACQAAGLTDCSAIVDMDDAVASALRHAPFADLVIVGERQAEDVAAQVALHSPRPTLVWPQRPGPESAGARVLLAWDGSCEATRAAGWALPVLERAEHVHVLWVDDGDLDRTAARAKLDALFAWLHRHGVHCVVHIAQAQGDVAATLRARAGEISADLVVMGAWGRPRWAERIIGGATHGVLRALELPVLMAH